MIPRLRGQKLFVFIHEGDDFCEERLRVFQGCRGGERDSIIEMRGEGYIEPLEVGGSPLLGVAKLDYL
jgi:hypothetical protein